MDPLLDRGLTSIRMNALSCHRAVEVAIMDDNQS